MIKNGLTSAEAVRELRREATEIRAKAKEEKDSYEQFKLIVQARRLEKEADVVSALFVRSRRAGEILQVEER